MRHKFLELDKLLREQTIFSPEPERNSLIVGDWYAVQQLDGNLYITIRSDKGVIRKIKATREDGVIYHEITGDSDEQAYKNI